ncbi:MAG: two-component system sensor histidine kinase BarA [Oleispira sp.]|jgi:two-component system sensor histidine kinase BarA
MKNWKLQNRILALVLLPGLIVSLFLGGFFIIQHMSDLDLLLQERGLAIAKQAAPTSEHGVVSGNNRLLQNLTNNLLEERDLRAARILNKDGKVLAYAGPKMITKFIGNTQFKYGQLQLSITDSSIRIKAPIFTQNIDLVEDISEPIYQQQNIDADLLGWIEIELSLANTQIAKYQHLATSITTVLITLILCLMLAIRMSRNISLPIQYMVDCVKAIGDGKIDARVHVNSGDEFQTLAAGINAMAIAIQRTKTEHQQNIEQATHDIRETLDNIEIQNIELNIARKEALEASRIKSEFLTNISHEIRTPLNGILGFTRILLKDQSDQRKTDHLNTIEKSANGLLTIINDILDLSKIDAGKLVLENIDFNVREILEDVLTINAPEAHKKSLELVSLIYSDVPQFLTGDPLRIKQVLTNLISNAIKFTPQGNITVRVLIEDENVNQASVKFEITDTGIGLSNEQQNKLFRAFSQADSSTTRQFGGTGLGLVISQHLVKAMQGDISVESAEGKGSTFSFSVTLKKSGQYALSMEELEGQQILLMESSSTTRLSITHLLEQWHVRYNDTDNSDILLQSLIRKQQNGDPADAVIIGLSRKELYHAKTAKLFKQVNSYNIPIIALVNSAISEELEYAQTLGAYQSLSKPLQSRKLFTSLCVSLDIELSPNNSNNQNRIQVPAPTILAVDDNEANLKLITVLLEDMGIRVIAADSGPQALLELEQHTIDMIFMDIQMPGMNGLEVTQLIRLKKTSKELPIIALTAHAIADEKDKILQVGMNDYQTKPINNDQLMQCIERWTGFHCDRHTHIILPQKIKPYAQRTLDDSITDATLSEKDPQGSCLIFDPQYAMRLANNKLDLAIDMFNMLLTGLTDDLPEIQGLWQGQQQEPLLQHIHKIHGATRYCGTPCLMHTLEQLETGLKNQALVDCENLYQKAIESIIRLQQWAQENQWRDALELAKKELV